MMLVNPYVSSGGISTQWRLLFPSGASVNATMPNFVEISEVEMAATAGGSDQCSGGSASASTTYAGLSASNAFANDAATSVWGCTSGNAANSWLQYTFASPVAVNEVRITARASATPPTSFRLQYYDGSQWITHLASETTALTWTGTETKTFTYSAPYVTPTGYTQWRFLIDTGASVAFLDISEAEMRLTPSGADQCFGGSASSDVASPNAAFDNTGGSGVSGWVTNSPSGGTGRYLQYTHFKLCDIREVMIQCRAASSGPQQFSVQYYDGATWQTSWQSASGLTWTAGEIKVFTKP